MALLERVSTLLRANINDLLLKAEDPEKLARQLILDMENQLMQVKTQVAIAIAAGGVISGIAWQLFGVRDVIRKIMTQFSGRFTQPAVEKS